jgi:hypothetical protein
MKLLCKYCNKEYSSYSSRCNHIKKYHSEVHKPDISHLAYGDKPCDKPNISQMTYQKVKFEYRCSKCNNAYKHYQSRWKHEQKCNGNNNNIKLENQILELKDLLQKALKVHPKTLQKINKQLNNYGTITNNTMQIIQLGKENLGQVLTEQDKLKILNRQGMSVNDLVELVHTSDKYNQFKNILVTNLQSSFCYKYDDKMMSFIAVNKDELLNDVLEARIYDINTFYDELRHLMNPKKAETLQRFLDKMDDTDSKIRNIKKEEIKLILYNNRNKIKDNTTIIEV